MKALSQMSEGERLFIKQALGESLVCDLPKSGDGENPCLFFLLLVDQNSGHASGEEKAFLDFIGDVSKEDLPKLLRIVADGIEQGHAKTFVAPKGWAMEHLPQCQSLEQIKQNEEFLKRYPNACKLCGGWGQHVHTEMHGFSYGVGETITEPCDGCTALGICARCGCESLDLDTGEGPCKECGWNYDDGLIDAECFCDLIQSETFLNL